MTDVAESAFDLAYRLSPELIAWRDGAAMLSQGMVEAEKLAITYETPLYVYDVAVMERQFSLLRGALPPSVDIFYSIKANPHPSVIAVFHRLGAGCEIASGGEYALARRAGVPPERIIFAGPAKGRAELEHVLAGGIHEIHVESFDEIQLLDEITNRLQTGAAVSIRINPNLAAGGGLMMGGQPTAFGFEEDVLPTAIRRITRCPRLELRGVHVYSGTQILEAKSLLEHWRRAIDLAKRASVISGQPMMTVDFGGGLGIPYFAHEQALDLDVLSDGGKKLFAEARRDQRLGRTNFILEPGRFLVASAGIYMVRVRSVKTCRGTEFVVVDGGMNHHLAASGNLGQVVRRDYPIVNLSRSSRKSEAVVVVTGPLCTPIDTLGRKIQLAHPRVGDLLAILQSGAYGLTASPVQFLSHPTPAEILVKGEEVKLITSRGVTFE